MILDNPIMFSGHRDMEFSNYMFGVVQPQLREFRHHTAWIHGGAFGFDSIVEEIARKWGVNTIIMRPNYNVPNKRFAPLQRNLDMLQLVETVVVWWDGRAGGGTAFVVRKAEEMGKRVVRLRME